MGIINSKMYENVIGKKILFKGKEAVIIKMGSGYEGDYWLIHVDPKMPPYKYDFFSSEGEKITKQADELQRRMANGESFQTFKHL